MLMAISRTPYRVSFFGGGTDYPPWFRRHGGAVLSMAINKYCYIGTGFLPPFFGIRHRIIWSHIEAVGSAAEIQHPAVRAGLEVLGYDDSQGIELFHQGDLPARSGIGSSSAFAVGLINVLTAMRGKTLDAHALAVSAMDLEQNKLKEAVGCQDQIASAYGGMNVIKFERDNSFSVTPLGLRRRPAPGLREVADALLYRQQPPLVGLRQEADQQPRSQRQAHDADARDGRGRRPICCMPASSRSSASCCTRAGR